MAALIIDLQEGDQQSTIEVGGSIDLGTSLYSSTGSFRLTFQASDGNIVLQVVEYSGVPGEYNANELNWTPYWSLYTQDKSANLLEMTAHGLAVSNAEGPIPTPAGTLPYDDSMFLVMQDDGNLVIYAQNPYRAVWNSDTSVRQARGSNA